MKTRFILIIALLLSSYNATPVQNDKKNCIEIQTELLINEVKKLKSNEKY